MLRASAARNIDVTSFDRAASAFLKWSKTIDATIPSISAFDGSELMMRYRELNGIDKVRQTQREKIVNNLARLSDIDRHLNRENKWKTKRDDLPQGEAAYIGENKKPRG